MQYTDEAPALATTSPAPLPKPSASAATQFPLARMTTPPTAGLGVFGAGQLWAKKLPGGGSAALVINHSPTVMNYTVQLAKLNLTGSSYKVRDIWAHKDLAPSSKDIPLAVPPYDSAFLAISPASE